MRFFFKIIFWTSCSLIGLMVATIAGVLGWLHWFPINYVVENNEVTIRRYRVDTQEVKLPEQIHGYPVTHIQSRAFDTCYSLTNIVLPSTLISIEDYAFGGCTNLHALHLPAKVSKLSSEALLQDRFRKPWNSDLTSVSIPGLKNITVDENNPVYSSRDGILFSKDASTLVSYPCGRETPQYTVTEGTLNLHNSAFENSIHLLEINLPAGITNLGDSVFKGCQSLKKITLPDSVQKLGRFAFWECVELESATLSKALTCIPEGAFEWCLQLQSIQLPDSITRIENAAFYSCKNLTNLVLPEALEQIGEDAFSYCIQLEKTKIPARVKEIGFSPWRCCEQLCEIEVDTASPYFASRDGVLFSKDFKRLLCYPCNKDGNTYSIPDTVTCIEPYAFNSCSFINQLQIPESVTQIGSMAFSSYSLTALNLPRKLTRIEPGTFAYSSLSSLVIPESISYIGNDAFLNCSKLLALYFMGDAPEASTNLFMHNQLPAEPCKTSIYRLESSRGWDSNWAGQPVLIWEQNSKPQELF